MKNIDSLRNALKTSKIANFRLMSRSGRDSSKEAIALNIFSKVSHWNFSNICRKSYANNFPIFFTKNLATGVGNTPIVSRGVGSPLPVAENFDSPPQFSPPWVFKN